MGVVSMGSSVSSLAETLRLKPLNPATSYVNQTILQIGAGYARQNGYAGRPDFYYGLAAVLTYSDVIRGKYEIRAGFREAYMSHVDSNHAQQLIDYLNSLSL